MKPKDVKKLVEDAGGKVDELRRKLDKTIAERDELRLKVAKFEAAIKKIKSEGESRLNRALGVPNPAQDFIPPQAKIEGE